jgi:amidophosphoribosyltransferase
MNELDAPKLPGPFDHPKEECGVVGVYAPGGDASRLTFLSLLALQHRGQESAGIAATDGNDINSRVQMGLVTQIFQEQDFYSLAGDYAIGHTRYSTTGSSNSSNAQPLVVQGENGKLALAHNGNIINALQMKRQLEDQWNYAFSTTTDSEVIAYLLAGAAEPTWEERLFQCMRALDGAFSLVALTSDTLMGARDALGIRPLCLGQLDGGWVIASESCALDRLGATFLREIEPGEAVVIDRNGLHSAVWSGRRDKRAMCVFELIYFARPDSYLDGELVYSMRQSMGGQLAREHPVDADLVIGVPDSATAAAVGYAQESGIPYSDGLVKNAFVGRTFIEPEQRLRDLGVRRKFSPLPQVVKGKRLVVVDDSIVRGTTTPHVVSLLRQAGAVEVHLRVCAPPIKHPCYMGVDMASRQELIAANRTVEEIRELTRADSLGYLSIEGLLRVVGGSQGGFCDACFSGNYPVPVQLELSKLELESPGEGDR